MLCVGASQISPVRLCGAVEGRSVADVLRVWSIDFRKRAKDEKARIRMHESREQTGRDADEEMIFVVRHNNNSNSNNNRNSLKMRKVTDLI